MHLIYGSLILFLIFVVLSIALRIELREYEKKRVYKLAKLSIDISGNKSVNADESELARRIVQQRLRKSATKKFSVIGIIKEKISKTGKEITLKQAYTRMLVLFLIILVILPIVFDINILISFIVSCGASFICEIGFLNYTIRKRQKKFTADFANALDVITRSVTVGLSLNESMRAVAYEMHGPVAEEFRTIVDSQKMGVDFDRILTDSFHRMPTAEFKFFTIVLQIQKQTGGSLSKTLGDLASVLRERKEMRDKILSLSSDAKSSAFIIGCLPIFITGILFVMSPGFMDPLFNTVIGNVMLGGGVSLMIIGVLVMRAMINFEI
jgi:tight adherence protein B